MLVRQPRSHQATFSGLCYWLHREPHKLAHGSSILLAGTSKCARTPVQTTGSAGQHGSRAGCFYSPQSAALDLPIEFLLRLRHGDHESETATEEKPRRKSVQVVVTPFDLPAAIMSKVRVKGKGDEARQAEGFGPVIR